MVGELLDALKDVKAADVSGVVWLKKLSVDDFEVADLIANQQAIEQAADDMSKLAQNSKVIIDRCLNVKAVYSKNRIPVGF